MKETITRKSAASGLSRRALLGGAAALGISPGLAAGAWAQGSDAPEKSTVKMSFLPVTDCASVVMAAVLQSGKKYGITFELIKETGPATQRDKILSAETDVGHMLHGQVQGVHAGVGGVQRNMAILMCLNYNGQAITVASQLKDKGATDGESLSKLIKSEKKEFTVAQTFPSGSHAMWLYYWLGSFGISPTKDVKSIAIPGPQMVANMRVGNMDAFCAGEPLGARAIFDKIGFTVAPTQAIWPDHPEKVLGCTAEFADRYPRTAKAVIAAVLDASRYIETGGNKAKVAETVADRAYVNNPVDVIKSRFLGDYEDGLGRRWKDANPMVFFADGAVNYPYVSDTLWFLTQHRRWKLLSDDVDMIAVAKAVTRTALYTDGAAMAKVAVPKDENRLAKLFDGSVWTAQDPKAYATSFAVTG